MAQITPHTLHITDVRSLADMLYHSETPWPSILQGLEIDAEKTLKVAYYLAEIDVRFNPEGEGYPHWREAVGWLNANGHPDAADVVSGQLTYARFCHPAGALDRFIAARVYDISLVLFLGAADLASSLEERYIDWRGKDYRQRLYDILASS